MDRLRKNFPFSCKVTFILFVASHNLLAPAVNFLVKADSYKRWTLNNNDDEIEKKGTVTSKPSPVGWGVYLDGSPDTYVKLKGYKEQCLGKPSQCDFTIGFLMKIIPQSGVQFYFGNKVDGLLYEGVNIYQNHNGKLRVEVLGNTTYCKYVITPPQGVWFYLGIVWNRVGTLGLYYDPLSSFSDPYYHCGGRIDGLVRNGTYHLGRYTYPTAYYDNLEIWYSEQSRSVFDERWKAASDVSGQYTVIQLTIIFPYLQYKAGDVDQDEFSNKVKELFINDAHFRDIKDVSVSQSNDSKTAVSFTLEFNRTQDLWESILNLQLAMENGTLLRSPGVFDEDSCQNTDDSHFFCEIPANFTIARVHESAAEIVLDQVFLEPHENYFFGYRVLYKNLDNPNSNWAIKENIRRYLPPNAVEHKISSLKSYTKYSFRVFAASFKSAGLISEAIELRTDESTPSIGPEIVASRSTSPTSIYVQWNHTIPENKVNGILIGYTVHWDDERFGHGHPYNSKGVKDLELNAINYTITSLHEYWPYTISVAGRTSKGAGIGTLRKVTTIDDAPSEAPYNIQLHMVNATTLNAIWQDVRFIHQNGIILGYRVRFHHADGGLLLWNVTVRPDVHDFLFSSLSIFQNYSVQMQAYARKGDGPWSNKVYQLTDESTPINSPVNLTAYNVSSREIKVLWNYDDNPRLVLGRLQGFTLYFQQANASDIFPEEANLKTFETRNKTLRSKIAAELKIYRLYNITIAARTAKGTGPTNESFVVRTHGEVPGASPQALTAYNTSKSSIYARWQEIVEDKQHGIMLGYKLFVYELTGNDSKTVENRTYGLDKVETNFTRLKIFTKYRIEVLGFNNYGDGPIVAVDLFTEESVPSQPPSNFTAYNESSTVLLATWKPVPKCCRLGIIRGYHATLTDPSNTSVTITKTVIRSGVRFPKLKKFHTYQISIVAFTSKGNGANVSTLASTDQDVPDAPPQTVTGHNVSQTEIKLLWRPVPLDNLNGILMGYKGSCRIAKGNQPSTEKQFNSSVFEGVLDGLNAFTTYACSVRAFTIKGDGPPSSDILVKTEEEAPRVAPTTFQGINSSSTSISLQWSNISAMDVAGVLRNFHIAYRELDTADNTTHTVTVPLANLTFELTDLRKYTNYSIEIMGVTKFVGIGTEPIIVSTDEDIPSLPPQDIKLQNSSSTSIFVQWKPIPKHNVHGKLLGIKLLYRSAPRDNSIVFRSHARRSIVSDWSVYTDITLPPNALSYNITSLEKFTNYSVEILGFTSKGDGNVSHRFIVSTDEDVPSMPPASLTPISRSGDFKMDVSWEPVPDGFVHGILLGYRIYYRKVQELGRASTSETEAVSVGPFEQNTTVTMLKNFAVYDLQIAAFTIKGVGVLTDIKDGSTCRCPREFKTTWYPFPPYITYENGTVGGFIPRILEGAVEYCCSDCVLANGKPATTIDFVLDGKGGLAQKSGVEALISSIDSQTDFSTPVNGFHGQTHYSLYRYVKLAESPGVGFITVMNPHEKAIAIANVFIRSWPLLLLSIIMMVAVGIIMWLLDARSNSQEFPGSFTRGAPEGLWWAFVTSTTVGYGDRCPRGVFARLFAISWTLSGLVVIAILTGRVATVLTEFGYKGPYIQLYGAEVAAIANNSDFRLGVRKNARMNTVRNYKSYEEISRALSDQEVKGALVDLYVLSSHNHLFNDPRFRIVRIYDFKTSYGVVLAGNSMKLEQCFTEHIKAYSGSVFQKIEDNIKFLREPDHSPAEQNSTELFSITSPQFIIAVSIIGSLLILACVLGVVYERRRKKPEVLIKSKDLKNEMSQVLHSFIARLKEKLEVISKRHRAERFHLKHTERERDQQAASTVQKCYEVLSLRDIRQEWSPRDGTVRSVTPSLPSTNLYNLRPRLFSEARYDSSPNVVTSRKLPLRRKSGFNLPVPLEPEVRIMDQTNL